MPTYDYQCDDCQHTWEERQRITDAPMTMCPKCKKKTARRMISAHPGSGFTLQGEGWFKKGGY